MPLQLGPPGRWPWWAASQDAQKFGSWNICLPAPSPLLLPGVLFSFFYWYMYFLMGGGPHILILQPDSWGFGEWLELGEEERVQMTCIGGVNGDRRWIWGEGWGLEDPRKRPASRHVWGFKICGSGESPGRQIFHEPNFWPSWDAARHGHLPGGVSCKGVPKA